VLSFPGEVGGSLGDIAVSLDHARAQARDFGHRMGDELRILMLHGVLHLLGMDHEADFGEMARAEVAWRKELRLPAGLIERVQV
jgi:probable rRNA maturation factor